MKMRKNDKKQKRSLLFSSAVVVAGCLVTALYVNQTMNTQQEYKVDLSELDRAEDLSGQTGDQASAAQGMDAQFYEGAGVLRTNGADVVNPEIETKQTSSEENPGTSSDEKENPSSSTEKENPSSSTGDDTRSSSQEQKESEKEQTSDKKEADKQETMAAQQSRETSVKETLSFSPQDGMSWPVMGDVILNYSMDGAVYFATLEQYKYNPAILIGAAEGEHVSSCVKGRVEEIGENAEIGKYIIMDAGNGYEVIYGQLDEIQVAEGDVAARGQVIANVGKVTKYYSVEGSHVYLEITKDGEPVDPLTLLQ